MLKNLSVFVVTMAMCLMIGEVALRIFTPFPIGWLSNMGEDPELGWRLKDYFGQLRVDENGFRNPDGKSENYDLAAIGDSHTYSLNVAWDEAWPHQFEEMIGVKTYNFGVGGYNVATYHPLVLEALEEGKQIIIGLNYGNDYGISYNFCNIDFEKSTFWQQELQRLNIQLDKAFKACDNFGQVYFRDDFKANALRFLKSNVALLSAFDHFIWDPLMHSAPSEQQVKTDFYDFGHNLQPLPKAEARHHAKHTDLSKEGVQQILDLFEAVARDWQARAKPNQIGFLIMPTRERTYYEILSRKGEIANAPAEYRKDVETQIALEKEIVRILKTNNYPHVFAVEEMIAAIQTARAKGEYVYPTRDPHPHKAGYTAYANGAVRLHGLMQPN